MVITIGGTTVYDTAQTSTTGTISQWFGTYSKDNAYAVSVKVYDSNYPTGTTKTATIQTAIYLIDALGSGTNVYAGVMHTAVNGQKLTLSDTKVDGSLGVNTSATVGTWLYVGTNATVVGTLTIGSDAVTDFVIGEGTSGGWYYRKWVSGKYECWKRVWGNASVSFSAWGSLFYADVDGPNFPITFAEVPIVIITPNGSQAYIIGNYNITTSAIGKIRFGHNSTGAVAAYADIYVYGRWR